MNTADYEFRSRSAPEKTNRAYDAWVDYQAARFEFTSITTINAQASFPNMLPLTINPSLIHRRVWAFFFSNSNSTYVADVDLIFYLKGLAVLRQNIVQWDSSFNTANALFMVAGTINGIYGGSIYTQTLGNPFFNNWHITPQSINIQADSVALAVNTLTSPTPTTALFDAHLQIASSAGI